MTGSLTVFADIYADDELAVLREQRLNDLHDLKHRRGAKSRDSKRKANDLTNEISFIDFELSYRRTITKAQNLKGRS